MKNGKSVKYNVKFEKAWLNTINSDGTAVVACQYYVDGESQTSGESGTKIIVYKDNMGRSMSDGWDFDSIVKISQNGFVPLNDKDIALDKADFVEQTIQNGEDADCSTIDAYYTLRDDFDWNDCQSLVDNFIEEIIKNFSNC